MSAYRELESRFHRLYALRNALGVLQWDMAAMMPAGGGAARGEQMAGPQGGCHRPLGHPAGGGPLHRARGGRGNPDEGGAAHPAEMRRQWIHATALDAALVEALSKATVACKQI